MDIAAVAAAIALVALLLVWWSVFRLNADDRDRADFYDFPDRDDTKMWAEIRAALNRPNKENI